ncbi:sugar phosphate isomerase/epimerase [Angustibacter speluncae]
MSDRPRRLGVSTWVWASPLDDSTLLDLAPRVAGMGFDVLELPVENPGDWDPQLARKVLDDNGLGATTCLVTSPGRELVAADAATVRSTQDYLRHCVDVAGTVGARVVGGPAYASVGRTWRMTDAERAGVYDELRTNLAPVVEHAAAAGVTIAVEPLNRYETSVLNTVAQALEALGPLLGPGCGLLLDTYHQNIEERSVPEAVALAGSHVAGVQVCANDRGAPGADHLDWPAILRALDVTGYDGPLCIESFTAHNDAIATAASIWRPLATSQDDLARSGLQFLREVQPAA